MYERNLVDELKWKIKSCFHRWVITDPYPELTKWQQTQELMSKLEKFVSHKTNPKPEISPHKAWMDGYEFAKNLVIKELEKK